MSQQPLVESPNTHSAVTGMMAWCGASARRLQQRLSSLGKRRGLLSLGLLNPLVLGLSLLLTWGFYLTVNLWLNGRVDSAYEQARIIDLDGVSSTGEAQRVYIEELGWLSGKDQIPWLDRHVERHGNQPLNKQVLGFIGSVASSSSENGRSSILYSQVTGRRRWSWLMTLHADSASTQEVVTTQLRFANASLERTLKSDKEDGAEKQQFLTQLVSRLTDSVHGPIRDLRRVNGSIQWIMVFLTILTAIVLVRRSFLLNHLSRWWTGQDDNAAGLPENRLSDAAKHVQAHSQASLPEAEQIGLLREEVQALHATADHDAYSGLAFMVGLMPSLGFIGTVWGMGAALAQADRLMSAPDQQQAIQAMTQELGYAFDTTLVGLVSAVALGIGVTCTRTKEWRLYDRCIEELRRRYLPAATQLQLDRGSA